ncbi:MAG: AAA family ATPase [Candidatus Obscuribacterales bacterium]|nr:AAA family ATPase [Steroidobacteraceae bacterium]
MTTQPSNAVRDGALNQADTTADELICSDADARVLRRTIPGVGKVIVKQALSIQAIGRLNHEIAILTRLANIAGVTQLVNVTAEPNSLVLTDEGGIALSEFLRAGAFSMAQVVEFACAISRILARVHKAGVIHKDICPDNILINIVTRQPTLIDFNIASSMSEQVASENKAQISGTLSYMSPEQTGRTGRAADQRSDLYSLGVTMYELVTRRKPFVSDDLLELIHDHLVRIPDAPRTVNDSVPQVVSDVIMRLLEKEPDRRYQSADGLAQDLMRISHDTTPFTLGERDFARRLVPPARPIGRDTEMDALQQALDQAVAGESNCAFVAGTPGVGKSALINEMRPMVAARRGWFVSVKFDQYRQNAAKAAVESLRAIGRLLLAEPEEQIAQYRERILKGLGSNAGFGPALLPEFVLLLGEQPPLAVSDPREAEARMLQATADLLRSVATRERPILIVMDDIQWAPPMSLRTLDTLIATANRIPGLLVLGAYRSNEVDSVHPLHTLQTGWEQLGIAPRTVVVNNLPPKDVGLLISTMLRLPSVEANNLATALNERTGGNPYDTIELINALRDDALLAPRDGLWEWNAAAIHQYVGSADAADILGRRIAKIPPVARELLEIMACLGSEVRLSLLAIATGLSDVELARRLAPALADGLLFRESSESPLLRFRHDRIHQAVFGGMSVERRHEQHLQLARRMVQHPELDHAAAEQYLPVTDALVDAAERRRVVGLFQRAAARLGALNYSMTERFLNAAVQLLTWVATPDDAALRFKLLVQHHAALYGLAQLDNVDAAYALILSCCGNPIELAEPAGLQMYSLIDRGRYQEAVNLGLKLLDELGLQKPDDLSAAIAVGLQRLITWGRGQEKMGDFTRAEVCEPSVLARAQLLVQTANAAYFADLRVFAWLILEGKRLWIEQGPCAKLMASTCGSPFLLVGAPQDYRGAYGEARHMIAVGEARGYQHATAMMRANYGFGAGHWVEPIENVITDFLKARAGLIQAGNVTYTGYTYLTTDLLLDCAPTIDAAATELKECLAFADRTKNSEFKQRYVSRHQLIQALLGKTNAPGEFSDDSFDEAAYAEKITSPTLMGATYHVMSGIAALIFGDTARMATHAAKAMGMLARAPGYYFTVMARVLHAVALSEQARGLSLDDRAQVLNELDTTCLQWLNLRAADAPMNFLHLVRWVEAERAWAADTVWVAGAAFDVAVQEAAQHPRPWHRAIINERAAVFHLSQGMENSGRSLMIHACNTYEAWGASGKVKELRRQHAFLRTSSGRQRADATIRGTLVDSEAVDMIAVLRASQALSSETSLVSLTAQVGKVLGAITGATRVQLIVKGEENSGTWAMAHSLANGATPITVEQAGAAGDVPLSVFRYAERTAQVLVIDDVVHDDRFSADPYVEKHDQCSLMLVPILKQGQLGGMLVLENNQRRGAFSAERLDSVAMIAGQLSVSLDNALLYASLEKRVAERTAQLRQKTVDINAMLQNMPQGVLTVMRGQLIHPEYSAYLKTIFETQEIANHNVMELVFGKSNLGADTVSQVDAAIGACIGEDEMNFDFNSHLLAAELDLTLPDGRVKSLALSWSPICDERGMIDKLMLCVRDVTELKRLEAEANTRKRELQMIGEILAMSQEKFHEFMDDARTFIDENKRLIEQATNKQRDTINLLFRNMHTLKGNARTYGLLGLTNLVHVIEQSYDDLRKNDEREWNPAALLAELAGLRAALKQYAHVNDTVLGRKDPGRYAEADEFLMVEKDTVQQAMQLLLNVDRRDLTAMSDALDRMGATFNLIGTQPLREILAGTLDSLPSLAKELGKEPPLVEIEDHDIAIRTQASSLLKNLFTHLLRNSVDHGIERAAERRAKTKPAVGRIGLDLTLDNGTLQIRLHDDGQGLPIAKIRQRALEQKLITHEQHTTAEELAQLIFRSGFSTAELVTEISGRGVGMDAVRGLLEKGGGSISIRFLDSHEAADFRAFETVISLPEKYAASRSPAARYAEQNLRDHPATRSPHRKQ